MCMGKLDSLGTEGTNFETILFENKEVSKSEIIVESKQQELVSSFSASPNQFGSNPEQKEEGPVRSHSSIVRTTDKYLC